MQQKIAELEERIIALKASSAEEAEQLRIQLLGKKGEITALFEEFRSIPGEQKRLFGQPLNKLKNLATEKIKELKKVGSSQDQEGASWDASRPANNIPQGGLHPISIIRDRIVKIFAQIGYGVSYGPEIEDDHHNFSALNFPEEHPARDMQDTFFVDKDPDMALRTHTSSVQVRVMESTDPPIRTISPGRVFRNEAISARAHCIFHQVEGLYIDKDVSFADLKQTLEYFATEMFGEKTKVRLRPSYFPFTEPSAEVDISCSICGGEGCNICKYTGWVEILGCGMVDPNVLQNCGIDPDVYSGFAFGMGVERIAQLKFRVPDLRMYFENDIRFLRQFSTAK